MARYLGTGACWWHARLVASIDPAVRQWYRSPMSSRVAELPARGRLIVATDLQGHVADFARVEEIFLDANALADGAHLVITGDLVHGPEIPEEQWPHHLGSFFWGNSPELLERAYDLYQRFPDRVHYLLGNHEHAHIGGPVVGKFFTDEAMRLETLLGAERSQQFRQWLTEWPLIAVAPNAGLLMCHGAPRVEVKSRDEIEEWRVANGDDPPDHRVIQLLWPRTASPKDVRDFMAGIDRDLRVTIYGHDVVRSGYAIESAVLFCLSTSFGCFDGDKHYIDWDLSQTVETAADLAKCAVRKLYPETAGIYASAAMRLP